MKEKKGIWFVWIFKFINEGPFTNVKSSLHSNSELRNKEKKEDKRGGVEEFRSIKIGVPFRVYGLVHT